MFRQLFIALTFIFISHTALAQLEYKEGFIVTEALDTVRGYVLYLEGVKSSREVSFRRTTDAQVTVYYPEDLEGYGYVNEKSFLRKKLKLEKDTQENWYFVEAIISGAIDLFYLEKFFIEKDDKVYALTNEQSIKEHNGKQMRVYTNKHRGILSTLLQDCKSLGGQIQTVKLSHRSLYNLIKEYHECTGQPYKNYISKLSFINFSIGVAGGINGSSLEFEKNPNQYYEYLTGDFTSPLSPIFCITTETTLPLLSKRFSLLAELSFTKSDYHSFHTVDQHPIYRHNTIDIKLSQVKIPLGLRYKVPIVPYTPYINAGLITIHHYKIETSRFEEVVVYSQSESGYSEIEDIIENQLGLFAGIGLLRPVNEKFEAFFDFRYERTNGITVDLGTISSTVTNLQFTVGLRRK